MPVFYYDDAVFNLLDEMVRKGNPNSVTDAAVGVLATRACIRGAYLNVRVNASGLKDRTLADKLITEGRETEEKAAAIEHDIINLASVRLG